MLNISFIREVGPLRWAYRTAVRQFYKRILKRDQKMRLPNGEWLTLPLSSRFATEAYITQADVDWGSERLLNHLIDGKGVFLDVGANIGYYSLYFAPKVTAVYSFEPDPRVRRVLEENARGKPRIHVVPLAVGASEGKANFLLESDAEVSHLATEFEQSGRSIEVEVTTIDTFVGARDLLVEAIKIDAEGHDIQVIEGALELLRRQSPIVLAELAPNARLFELLHPIGYRVFAFVRERTTRNREFAELRIDVPAPGDKKMLFLIPERLVERAVEAARGRNAK